MSLLPKNVSVVTFALSATPDYEDKSLLQERQLETAAMLLIQLAQPQIPTLIILNPRLKLALKKHPKSHPTWQNSHLKLPSCLKLIDPPSPLPEKEGFWQKNRCADVLPLVSATGS